ncbi:4'-phosphopantetheinyl transferase family protein [Streptomyces rapamycinicus]|uniref:4-phosphopantetheinyl transferase n=2 Tax=Streptomyces rapamycinicus TaxID=1226757 RepID=A0A0A0NDM9_STRRN|nr:4'-phosphopantetheinyl transferase superfamily protein [Streptomyces rapamycinicus]AGP57577.1 4-phosphopantetheinyl transferase [Streptomyces rapamycinicus NRRL 5491]MBB4785237.1 4'-phosphopantetheinyl transferase [Streptomyces rapamycinicus]RLV79291.1 4-phosphopantetheinyl transferase [Streptomyces rapamycinicus NRRL 5491]UTO65447.1 4'-phosphopantetheinyl transferase superfamily protein [Streptomyces rapamycinicus]UTP33403.1 4'-phosphopantetheinyl transferase superfamily protein [Streptomy
MSFTSPVQPAHEPRRWAPVRALPGPGDRPGPGEVAVWLLRIPPYATAAAAVAEGLLDERERERAARLRSDVARERYVTSHVGLRTLLGGYLGIDPAEVAFTRETCGMPDCEKPHGRPALAGEDALHFSLSHSGDAALCAVAGVPVGADVEERDPGRAGARLTGLVGQLHPEERAAIDALPEELREEAFLGCWVRKEAYLKGIGTGLPGGIGAHHVGLAEGLAPAGAPPGPRGWAFADLDAPPGYHAAVAVRDEALRDMAVRNESAPGGAARPVVTLAGLPLV